MQNISSLRLLGNRCGMWDNEHSMPIDPTLNPLEILKTLGIHDPTQVTPVQGGSDTAIWRVKYRDATYALRLFRREQVETYQRELAAMGLAQEANLPVPTVHASAFWQERPVMLLAWCAGSTVAQLLLQQPWRIWPLGKAFGRMQARIHAVSANGMGGGSAEQWIAWSGAEDAELAGRLRSLAPAQPSLLHLDYHPLNVLASGNEITAVLDWANARAGDPRADLARTYTILRVEPYNLDKPAWLMGTFRRLLAWSWRRGYEEVAGPLRDMAPFYAWAGAVMQREVARRVADPSTWWQPEHLAQVRAWTEGWRKK